MIYSQQQLLHACGSLFQSLHLLMQLLKRLMKVQLAAVSAQQLPSVYVLPATVARMHVALYFG